MERVDDKNWDLFQKTLEEHFQEGKAISPLKLMYGDSAIPERSIVARDVKNLCDPQFIYYLHDDQSQIPEAKRNADKGHSVDIVYEDEHIVAVNKPSGLLTVPHEFDDTHATSLMNRLIAEFSWATSLPRAGLVHRLDLGTTGVCIVAKKFAAYSYFKLGPEMVKKYLCISKGNFKRAEGVIDIPLRAGPNQGRRVQAKTTYLVKEAYSGFQLLECEIEKGRFHQIREHLKKKNHPVVGEYRDQKTSVSVRGKPDYFERRKRKSDDPVLSFIRDLNYPCLHAKSIEFLHPITTGRVKVEAPNPVKLSELIALLQENRLAGGEPKA